MADFVKHNDDYPYLENTPDIYKIGDLPAPSLLYKKEVDGYPYLEGFPEIILFNSPTPYLMYKIDGAYDGVPHLDYPKMYDIFTKPIPSIYYSPNKYKKTVHTVMVQKVRHSVTVQKNVPQTVMIKQPKQQFISVI